MSPIGSLRAGNKGENYKEREKDVKEYGGNESESDSGSISGSISGLDSNGSSSIFSYKSSLELSYCLKTHREGIHYIMVFRDDWG